MEIYLDFDGTVVEFDYPRIGKNVPHALRVINRIQKEGIPIILNTQRVEMNDNSLDEALCYLEKNNINITSYTKRKIIPYWNIPFKEIIFIDDIATGIPLLPDNKYQMMVNWLEVERELEKYKIL